MPLSHFLPSYYVNAGSDVIFRVGNEIGIERVRWRLNGQDLAQSDGQALSLTNVGTTAGGTYSAVVSERGREFVEDIATLTVVSEAYLTHFYVSGGAGSAEAALHVGFVIDGAGSKKVLVRGRRREKSSEKMDLILQDWAGKPLPANECWHDALTHSSLLEELPTGTYVVRAENPGGGSSVIRVEVCDADSEAAQERPMSVLMNASGRGPVGVRSAALEIGFTISGSTSDTILLRGVGPGLKERGLGAALPRTRLDLYSASGDRLASNQGWAGDPALETAFARAGAYALSPASADSALLATLLPGSYTARLTAPEGAEGIGLVELYEVPAQ